jgi:hypothetical protein
MFANFGKTIADRGTLIVDQLRPRTVHDPEQDGIDRPTPLLEVTHKSFRPDSRFDN